MSKYYDILFGEWKMGKCVECGKNLGLLRGYRHPTYGKKNYLCRSCFDTVYESVEKYREFISPYVGFFKNETPVNKKQSDLTSISEQFTHTIHIYS